MTPERQAALEEQFKNLDAKMDAIHRSLKADIEAVIRQTTATNGRVTEAERKLIAIDVREEERTRHETIIAQIRAEHMAEVQGASKERSDRWWSLVQPIASTLGLAALVGLIVMLATGQLPS